MKIADQFTVQAPVEKVWDFLQDIPRVAECMPGVEEVREVGPDEYEGKLKVKVGPIGAAFGGRVRIVEREAPRRMVAEVSGDDRTSATAVKATFTGVLEPEGEAATRIAYDLDVTLRGRLAQFGSAVVQGTAKKMAAEFARRLQEAIADEGAGG